MTEEKLSQNNGGSEGLSKLHVEINDNGSGISIEYRIKIGNLEAGNYQILTDPEYANAIDGVIGIQYGYRTVIIDCAKCPALQGSRLHQQRVMPLQPDGTARQKISEGIALIVDWERSIGRAWSQSRKNHEHDRDYRKWQRARSSDRYKPMGYS